MKRMIALLLVLAVGRAMAQEPAGRPKLVVVLVIDQFRPEYLRRFRPYFGRGGFNLLLQRGANFRQAEYQHSATLTCPGHAVILSGTHGNVNGIISNQWFNARSGRQEYCAADSSVTLIGSSESGRSPRNLLAATIGDGLKQATGGRSKVITMAGKDRSAIMLGGHQADGAYWMEDSLFISSTYYMRELPGWVQQFNGLGRVRSYAGRTWNRLLPRAAYTGPDDVAAEENVAGMGRVFPHRLSDSTARFLDGFRSSPFQNEVLFEFAMNAVSSEKLGEDDDPDLLGISLSANDLVGHAFGPASHEVMDVTLRTDRVLERFFTFLDQRVGLDHIIVVLTADHGVAPLPERVEASRGPGRLDPARIAAAAEAGLEAQFGAAPAPGWVLYTSSPWLYLNLGALRQRGIAVEQAESTARAAVRGVRGVHQALTATELRLQQDSGRASSAGFSFYPDRSGNIYFELKPFVLPSRDPTGTTHGSPWSYDARVPLLWMGAAIKRGAYPSPASIADIAPTLATILGIPEPARSQGRVLQEMLR